MNVEAIPRLGNPHMPPLEIGESAPVGGLGGK